MKKIILPFLLLFCCFAQAQVMKTKKEGVAISFFSATPIEDISAVNRENTTTGLIVRDSVTFRLYNQGFKFESALMQEHFNENYMESEKYPVSSFRGKINEPLDFSKNGSYPVSATGNLDIHGVVRLVTLKGTMKVQDGGGILDVAFPVRLEDHNIKRPTAVLTKIAEVIDVKLHAEFTALPVKK